MKSYEEFFSAIPIPWLTQGPNGQAFWSAWGKLLDDQANSLKSAVLASFPNYAPHDAYAHLENEYGLLQGKFSSSPEGDFGYGNRLLNAFVLWKYAGTPLGILLALYWLGYTAQPGVQLVQQNGLILSLNSAFIMNNLRDYSQFLSVGYSPVSLFEGEIITVTFAAGTYNSGDKYLFGTGIGSSSDLISHDGVGPTTITVSGTFTSNHRVLITITNGGSAAAVQWTLDVDGVVVAGNVGSVGPQPLGHPWWAFDGRLDLCDRYAIRFPAASIPSWWTNQAVPANPQSSPSLSEINTIFRAVQLWGPAKARCLYVQTPGTLSHFWGDGRKFGDGSTWGSTGRVFVWGNPNLLDASISPGLGIQQIGYLNNARTPGGGFANFNYYAIKDHKILIQITATGTAATCSWTLFSDLTVVGSAVANATISGTIDGQPITVTLLDNGSYASSFVNGDVISYLSHTIK